MQFIYFFEFTCQGSEMFDPDEDNPYALIRPDVVDCDAHRVLARKMATESMVLLKNEENLLPLSRKLRSIAVVGPAAMDASVLWGNYNGFSSRMVTRARSFSILATAGALSSSSSPSVSFSDSSKEMLRRISLTRLPILPWG